MKILSRLMSHFGYVRLKEYGYELTPNGRIVEVVKVEDDRFAPPPWQPVGLPSAVSLLPPMKPPVPRPLPPAPVVQAEEAEPAPLFRVPGALATVETAPPGEADDDDDEAISIDEVPEEEEWEWKMALARARETAEKDKKEREKGKAERMAARRGDSPSFPTSALPLAAPPSRTKVVDSPKPMSKIARPEPKLVAEPRKGPEPTSRIARVEPRAVTAQPVASRTPRTVPPKAPPGRKTSQLSAVAAATRPAPAPAPAPAGAEPKSPVRASIEKSVSRVFSPPTPSGKARPLPRLARGTESPMAGARPTRPQLALGSTQLPAMRDPSADVTATDITAVDRAQASMREDEDTRVNVAVLPPSADITLDIGVDPEAAEVENTTVDPQSGRIGVVAVTEGSPLPRLTARLRRQSVPN